ncbi:hypothetical protein BsWGS_23783 [Bradybaena similaris]
MVVLTINNSLSEVLDEAPHALTHLCIYFLAVRHNWASRLELFTLVDVHFLTGRLVHCLVVYNIPYIH